MKRIWPFRYVGLKIVAVAFAIILWMAVSGEQTVERGLRIPLELEQFPSGLELQGDVPATVDVRIRGTSGALGRLAPGDVTAVIDLRGAKPGRRLFALSPEQVRVASGVQVVQVTPSTVAMVFEESASRQVPVVPDVDGRPAAGFVIGKVTVDPATVEVVGPASAVARVTEALTEPVSIAGAHDPITERVTVGLVDAALRLKRPQTAVVTVPIVPAPAERAFTNRPVHLRNVAAPLIAEAEPTTVSVHVRAERGALSHVDPDALTAYVDLTGLGTGQYQLAVRAEAAPDIGVTRIDPPSVQVRISRGRN